MLTLVGFVPSSVAQSLTASATTANSPKIAAKNLYPKPSLTRGKAENLNRSDLTRAWPCPVKIRKASCSYSEAHRDVPSTVRKRVYEEYGIDPRHHVPGEIDHFYLRSETDASGFCEEIEMNLNQRLRRLETTFVDEPIVLSFEDGSTREIRYSGNRILGLLMAAMSGEVEPCSPTRQHLEWIRDSNGCFDPAGGHMIDVIRLVLAAGTQRFQQPAECIRPAILGPMPMPPPTSGGCA